MKEEAIRAFLRTGQDIEVPIHLNVHFQSLRAILLETLYGMSDPIAKAANLEVLKNTPVGSEVFLAACNLEELEPGVHRQEVLKAICEVLAHTPSNMNPIYQNHKWFDAQMMQFIGYYQAQEVIPEIENLLFGKGSRIEASWTDGYSKGYLDAITKLPAADQVQILKRLAHHENEEVRNHVFDMLLGYQMASLDFQNGEARQLVQEIFTSLSSLQKKECLQAISHSAFISRSSSEHYIQYIGCFGNGRELFRSNNNLEEDGPKKGRIEGTLRLLDELAPQMDTPILKERLENTRKEILQINPL